MPPPVKIANASAFWGDSPTAAQRLLKSAPDVDYLTLDYLAEVSMSILARQMQKDPAAGWTRDFLAVVQSLLPYLSNGLKIITNAGGLNPPAAAQAVSLLLKQANLPNVKIATLTGDNVLPQIQQAPQNFPNSETNAPLSSIQNKLLTANAYLGADGIVQALNQSAQIIITGRVADPSLTVAPAIFHHHWAPNDYNKIAAATIAGHLIECGPQVTGGVSTNWLSLIHHDPSFPIAQILEDGTTIISIPPNTHGVVSQQTVKEQLLYEIGDPDNYLSPDATVSLLNIQLKDLQNNHVQITGPQGRPPPQTYKVSATYQAGYRSSAHLLIAGPNPIQKAHRAAQIILDRLQSQNKKPQQHLIECLGANAAAPGILPPPKDLFETVLRLSVADPSPEPCQAFSHEFFSLISAGPQGTTGYAQGRPPVSPAIGYWPTTIPRQQIQTQITLL